MLDHHRHLYNLWIGIFALKLVRLSGRVLFADLNIQASDYDFVLYDVAWWILGWGALEVFLDHGWLGSQHDCNRPLGLLWRDIKAALLLHKQ